MAKAKPLKDRKKVWAKRISAVTLKLVKLHNDFQKFCHHPNCREAKSGCPQSRHDHPKCVDRLSIHTALLWGFKLNLSDVICELHNARYELKNGALRRIYYELKSAEEALEPLQQLLWAFDNAATYHVHHPDPEIVRWCKLVNNFRNAYLIPNAIEQLAAIRKSVRIAAKRAKVSGWEHMQEDCCK